MKLLRYGPRGAERPAILDSAGQARDLSAIVEDIDPALLEGNFAALARLNVSTLPAIPSGTRTGPPLSHVGKFVCIGLNYSDHAAEARMPIPKEPILFLKATSAVCGPDDDVVLPPGAKKSDWEVELGVIIGRECRYVSEEDAMRHVAGVCVVNDLSEREYQLERGGQWDKGKCCETFNPLGPFLRTADDLVDPQSVSLRSWVNGEPRQDGSTKNMIFPVAEIVRYLSQFMVLEPGDLINTGTPAGVALGNPNVSFLRAGDVVELEAEGLGRQRQTMVQA